jgi:hypothetical protein
MAYAPTVHYRGEVARDGHRTVEIDVDYNNTDTELAGVGNTHDLTATEGPYDGTVYKAPLSVSSRRRHLTLALTTSLSTGIRTMTTPRTAPFGWRLSMAIAKRPMGFGTLSFASWSGSAR